MHRTQFRFCAVMAAAVLASLTLATSSAHAQFGGGGGGLGGGGGGGGAGGGIGGGGGGNGGAGIVIRAKGVLQRLSRDASGALKRKHMKLARRALGKEAKRWSPLRVVSLNRLEAAIAERRADGKPATRMQLLLGGLTKLQYVFYLPETNDLCIAGPAEAFYVDGEREVRGLMTDKPVLLLADLVVALRAFAPGKEAAAVVGCSIDPTREGLAKMQRYLTSISRNPPRNGNLIASNLKRNLGLQTVTFKGISPKTHFAYVMLSADYRMKLIGMGLEKPPVPITSYVKVARSQESMVRWWFTPNYEVVRATDDGLAMELVGDGVKLVGEGEVVGLDGRRKAVGRMSRASKRFVDSFTRRYAALAVKDPTYAHLRNLVDMTIATAYMQNKNLYDKADWQMEMFGDESRFQVEVLETPKHVETAVRAVWKGNRLFTPVGGGVNIQPTLALQSHNLLEDADGKVHAKHKSIDLSKLDDLQWWWDAEGIHDVKN